MASSPFPRTNRTWLCPQNSPGERLQTGRASLALGLLPGNIQWGEFMVVNKIDDCNMSICCSSTDHPPLMTSKVIPPKKMFGMVCSAPHTRKKPRNFIKHGNYMQLHQVSTFINPISTLRNQCNKRIHQASTPNMVAPNTPGATQKWPSFPYNELGQPCLLNVAMENHHGF